VYMAQEEKQAHKTNRDWHLNTSSSDNRNNNINIKDDSVASDTTNVTSKNTNVNNYSTLVSRDVDDTEDYEPTDPDNFEEKITEIAWWTHEDLAHNTVLGVQTFMLYLNLHSYR
jgi:hypothetical protein